MWSTFSSYSSENGNQWCQFSRSTQKNSSNRFHRARTAYKASKDDSLYALPPTLLLFLSRISICHSRWPCSLVKVTRAVTWSKNVGHDKIVSVRWESWSVSVYWLAYSWCSSCSLPSLVLLDKVTIHFVCRRQYISGRELVIKGVFLWVWVEGAYVSVREREGRKEMTSAGGWAQKLRGKNRPFRDILVNLDHADLLSPSIEPKDNGGLKA